MPSAPLQRLTGACDLSRSPNEVQRRKGDFKHCSHAALVAMHLRSSCALAKRSASPVEDCRAAGLPGWRATGFAHASRRDEHIKVANFACRGPVNVSKVP
jgi:hypothetical protein